jgi:hypothetical protein
MVRIRVQIPQPRIEEFFVWLDRNCKGWNGYADDDVSVSINIQQDELDTLTAAWPDCMVG